MPTPPLKPGHPRWPDVERAVRLYTEGMTIQEIAVEFGLSWSSAKNWIDAFERWERLPNGVQEALESTGIDPSMARGGWKRVEGEDGSFNSVYWRMPDQETEDALSRITEILSDIPAAKPVKTPDHSEDDLLNVVNVSDLHSGMLADPEEVGQGYKTQGAVDRLTNWAGDCISRSPKAGECVILFNGDTLHANDHKAQTPTSGHVLDVDGRFFRTVDMTVLAIAAVIDQALTRFQKVQVVIKAGNHDLTSYIALVVAMKPKVPRRAPGGGRRPRQRVLGISFWQGHAWVAPRAPDKTAKPRHVLCRRVSRDLGRNDLPTHLHRSLPPLEGAGVPRGGLGASKSGKPKGRERFPFGLSFPFGNPLYNVSQGSGRAWPCEGRGLIIPLPSVH